MKVTIKESTKEEPRLPIKDVPAGYVFKIVNDSDGHSGPTALKLCNDVFVVLSYTSGNDWFVKGESCWNEYSIKVLGKLTEIIVKE